VKTPEQLFQLYLKSVGRGANLLLNVPPDRRGLINEKDSAALVEFKRLRDKSFADKISKAREGYYITHNGRRPAPKLNDDDLNTFEYIPIANLMSMGIEFEKD